jgi:hypothetical protein
VVKLYDRVARVLIEDLELTGLDVRFRVQRTLKPEQDTLQLSIWNLNQEHRAALQRHASPTAAAGQVVKAKTLKASAKAHAAAAVQVRLEAGYLPPPLGSDTTALLNEIGATSNALPLIFGGDVREIWTTREGTDWVTTLTAGDGDTANTKRVNKSFGPGTPLRFAIEQVCSELGLGLGQLPKEIASAALWDGGRQFPSGIVLSGHGFTQLTRLLTTAGYRWTVQDGEIVVVKRGSSFGTAVLLTPKTGLVGSPTPANDGRVSATSLLQPDLVPGRQVEFRAEHVTGHYLVETAAYVGERASQDWYVEIEAAPL